VVAKRVLTFTELNWTGNYVLDTGKRSMLSRLFACMAAILNANLIVDWLDTRDEQKIKRKDDE